MLGDLKSFILLVFFLFSDCLLLNILWTPLIADPLFVSFVGPNVQVSTYRLFHFDSLSTSYIDVNRESSLSLLIKRSASFINYLMVIAIYFHLKRLQHLQGVQ